MAAPQGTLRVYQDRQTLTFRIDGQATMLQSLPLRRLAERAAVSGVTSLRVDLGRSTYMDSTFVGTLLCLKRASEERKQGSFALTALSPPCQRLLEQMGLANYFALVKTEEPPAGAWVELSGEPGDPCTFQITVIEAHQGLASLPGPTGEVFREVMRCVTQDLEAKRAGQAPTGPPPAHQPEASSS